MASAITEFVFEKSKSGNPEPMKIGDTFVIKGIKYICIGDGKNWLGDPMPTLMTYSSWIKNKKAFD